jgi:TnpA family transposase
MKQSFTCCLNVCEMYVYVCVSGLRSQQSENASVLSRVATQCETMNITNQQYGEIN